MPYESKLFTLEKREKLKDFLEASSQNYNPAFKEILPKDVNIEDLLKLSTDSLILIKDALNDEDFSLIELIENYVGYLKLKDDYPVTSNIIFCGLMEKIEFANEISLHEKIVNYFKDNKKNMSRLISACAVCSQDLKEFIKFMPPLNAVNLSDIVVVNSLYEIKNINVIKKRLYGIQLELTHDASPVSDGAFVALRRSGSFSALHDKKAVLHEASKQDIGRNRRLSF